jgi:hypothetical protein
MLCRDALLLACSITSNKCSIELLLQQGTMVALPASTPLTILCTVAVKSEPSSQPVCNNEKQVMHTLR